MSLPTDAAAAAEFLELLDPNAAEFCFRTFDDKNNNSQLAKNFTGPLEDSLSGLSARSTREPGIAKTLSLKTCSLTPASRVARTYLELTRESSSRGLAETYVLHTFT